MKTCLLCFPPASFLQSPTYFVESNHSHKGGLSFFPRILSYPFEFFIKDFIQSYEFLSSFNDNRLALYYYSSILSRGIIDINNYRNIPVHLQIPIFSCSIICYKDNISFLIDICDWYNMWYVIMRCGYPACFVFQQKFAFFLVDSHFVAGINIIALQITK